MFNAISRDNGPANAAPKPETRDLANVRTRLSRAHEYAGTLIQRLDALSDRLEGAAPKQEGAGGCGADMALPNGHVPAVHAHHDLLCHQLETMSGLIARIEAAVG